ncbi:MAG: glycosyltransferase [Lachnospiraceae bacterium]|nr:glycosyltransferase [Lachnospiraceae bacterium]
MNYQPLITIIMPSLNVADYIEECLNSVCNQTLKDIEILCIDAKSDDGTMEIISRFADEDSRVRLILSEKRSYGYQVNLGLSIAKGTYVAILETDDYVEYDMYERLYEATEEEQYDYVKCDYKAYWTQKDGERLFYNRKSMSDKKSYGQQIYPTDTLQLSLDDWFLWNGIYRKAFLDKYNIHLQETPGAAYQDIGFLCQINMFAKKACYIDNALYCYCLDRDGASSNSGKGLRYAYGEYNNILQHPKVKQNKAAERNIYIRMSKSVSSIIDNTMDGNAALGDEDVKLMFEWFGRRLEYAGNEGYISQEIIGREFWENINLLRGPYEEFVNAVVDRNKALSEFVENHKNIFIFGCGHYGYRAYKWIMANDCSLMAFSDNNEKLWNTYIDGIKVVKPNELPQNDEAGVIIANASAFVQIKNQLIELGISRDNILVW